MQKYGGKIYGFLCSKTGDAELAKDLAQDTWLKVYRYFKIGQFNDVALIYNKALQVFLDYRKAAKVRRILGYCPDPAKMPTATIPRAGEGQPSETFAWDEFWSNFKGAEFDPVDQQCFWLLHRYDFTMKEVSERLGMPISTIQYKVERLMEKCRRILEREEP